MIYNAADFPLSASDLPFASPGAGQLFQFASPPRSRSCWKQVRKCEWVKYKSSCGNVPSTVCEDKLIQDCRRRCQELSFSSVENHRLIRQTKQLWTITDRY